MVGIETELMKQDRVVIVPKQRGESGASAKVKVKLVKKLAGGGM